MLRDVGGLDDKKRFFESDYSIIWENVVLLENRFYQLIPLRVEQMFLLTVVMLSG